MSIIGISGKAEAGKDTVSGFLLAVYPRQMVRRAFADALKHEALREYARRDRAPFRESILDTLIPERVLILADQLKNTDLAFRTFLQAYGQARRAVDPLYWINRCLDDHKHSKEWDHTLIIPDVRYRNEAEMVLDSGGIVLRINRPGHENRLTPEQRRHPSETDLDDFIHYHWYTIENDGNPVHLLRDTLAAVRGYVRA